MPMKPVGEVTAQYGGDERGNHRDNHNHRHLAGKLIFGEKVAQEGTRYYCWRCSKKALHKAQYIKMMDVVNLRNRQRHQC